MIMEKITKEDDDVVVVMAEEEEVEAIITISTIIKGAINHIEVEEEEEVLTILDQMRGGMISLMLNVTTVTNLGIMLGNVMVQLIKLRSKSMLLMTSKKPKSPPCC